MKHLIKFLGIFAIVGYLMAIVYSVAHAIGEKVRECKDEYEFKKGMDEYLRNHPF